MQEGQEVIINLSAASFTSFPNMLLSLDESRQASKIRDYGISLTSLDEVFMRIEDDGNAKPPPAAAIAEHNSVESVQIDAEEQSQADGQVVDSLMTETPVPQLGESASSRRRKTIERAEKQYVFVTSTRTNLLLCSCFSTIRTDLEVIRWTSRN
jgi:hypothetical protein